jgi:ABC-type transport system substrate-binding protein
VGGTEEEAAAKVDAGRADMTIVVGPRTSLPTQIEEFQADPTKGHVNFDSVAQVHEIEMNLATPPFDDVHVRRAMNWAIDKQRLVDIVSDWIGAPVFGEVASHMAPDPLENNLLLPYHPYPPPGGQANLEAAKAEMRLSRYDTDGDGVCDSPKCRGILTEKHMLRAYPLLGREVKRELKAIGLELDLVDVTFNKMFPVWYSPRPRPRVAMFIGISHFGFRTAGGFWRNGFYSPNALGEDFTNGTLVGASPDQLRRWGYTVTSVPTLDDRIERCLPTTGNAAFQCWAALDQYVTENIAPLVPFMFSQFVQTTSNRVVHYSFDQRLVEPAFDQIAVQG